MLTNGQPTLLDHHGNPIRGHDGSAQAAGIALPHGWTFISRSGGSSNTYWHDRFDEALRHAREDAEVMTRDAGLMALLQERILAVNNLPWHLEIPDEKDKTQTRVRDTITRIVKGIRPFRRITRWLYEALWFGKSAVQVEWEWCKVRDGDEKAKRDIRGLTVRQQWPVQGDKIGHQYDHTPYVLIYSAEEDSLHNAEVISTVLGRAITLRGSWRERFLIHKHLAEDVDYYNADQAEAIHGVGLRSKLFWLNWLKLEWLGNITDYFDRVGCGLTIWRFQQGNTQALAAVKQAANEQQNRAHIFVPVSPDGGKDAGTGVERIEVPTSGADALLKLIEYVDTQIERYVVGQEGSASSTSSSGHSNESSTEFQQDTKRNIAVQDSSFMAESLTGDKDNPSLISTIQKYTYPWADFPVTLVFDVESGESDKRLQAVKTVAVDLGIPVKADEARKAAGLSKPADGDELVKPPQAQQQGGMPGAGGSPGEEGDGGEEQPEGDFLDSLRDPDFSEGAEQPEGDFAAAMRQYRDPEKAIRYGWVKGAAAGTSKGGEPLYRWTGTDLDKGKSRIQITEPGSRKKTDKAVTSIGQFGPDNVQVDMAKVKLPYKTTIGDRLEAIADKFGDKVRDLLVEEEQGASPEKTERALSNLFSTIRVAVRDAIRNRGDALARWAVYEHGDRVKGFFTYKQLRKATQEQADKAYEAFMPILNVVQERKAEDKDFDSTDDEIKEMLPDLTKTLRMSAKHVGVQFVGFMDELEAWNQGTVDEYVVTPPPSKEESRLFPPENHARSLKDIERKDVSRSLDEDELPQGLRPILMGYDGYVLEGEPLTEEQVEAVHEYTLGGYRQMNAYLRDYDLKKMPPKAKKRHNDLQSVFNRLVTSEEPVTVYRGLNLHAQQVVKLVKQLKDAHQSGEPIRFAGYSSTTFDPSIAFFYGEQGKDSARAGGSGHDVVFEISARRGLNVGALSKDKPKSNDLSEQELLLDHDTAFKVAAIRRLQFAHPETGAKEHRLVVQLIQEV